MFVLAKITDTVRTPPHRFGEEFTKSLREALDRKLANKVVLDVGLCVCFFDFERIYDSHILPTDGSYHTKVDFRYVVFRPFVDEIVMAKIKSCTCDGIHLTMGFFDDIFIPRDRLPHKSAFRENDQVWIWYLENEEDPGQPPAEMFMEPGSEVRFRVVSDAFQDVMPTKTSSDQPDESVSRSQKPSYAITGTMEEDGLGCVAWWS